MDHTLMIFSDISSIEDAPGPMALHSFETQVKDGKILVTAKTANTLKSNLSRQPKLLATTVNASVKGVIIVGGGPAALNVVESLREVS
jgi:apoptosis-inducing factor 3